MIDSVTAELKKVKDISLICYVGERIGNIIAHKKMTLAMKRAIKERLRDYTFGLLINTPWLISCVIKVECHACVAECHSRIAEYHECAAYPQIFRWN